MNRERSIDILLERESAKLKDGVPVKSKAVFPAKPKSLVQLAAEKLEQSIKQPAKMPKPSQLLPTLKTLASRALVKDKNQFWNEKAINYASINRLDRNTIRGGGRPIPAPRTKKQRPVAAQGQELMKNGELSRVSLNHIR